MHPSSKYVNMSNFTSLRGVNPILSTADEALNAKLSTIRKGYYKDPFLSHFASRSSSNKENRNYSYSPIIRRGTYGRVCVMDTVISYAIDRVVKKSSQPELQVIVLGAGKDSAYFRLRAGLLTDSRGGNSHVKNDCMPISLSWYEVDQPEIIDLKKSRLSHLPDFCMKENNNFKHYLIPFDLQGNIHELLSSIESEECYRFDKSKPTLVLMECVRMYLRFSSSCEILAAISKFVKDSMIAIYDPMLLEDAFGRIMRRNFIAMRFDVGEDSDLICQNTLKKSQATLEKFGFDMLLACDMLDAYQNIISSKEQNQVSGPILNLQRLESNMLSRRQINARC